MSLQEQFSNEDSKVAQSHADVRNKERLAEESKQKKIASLMKECNTLVKESKLDEAYRLAMVVKQMDPDNDAVSARFAKMLELKRNLSAAQKLKKDNAEYFLQSMNDTDSYGSEGYLSNKDPMSLDPKRMDIAINAGI